MKFLRNLVTLLIVLAMVAVGILFALQNEVQVPLDLLVYTFPARSLALWVLGALALGGILGLILSSFLLVRQRAALSAANRQLARTRQEVDKLRTAGLTEGE